jgi:L-ribulose-5-phosphate 3-epimerase
MLPKIGYMQGRLSDQVNGMIQCFPWDEWEAEFPRANHIGVKLMEWTLDQYRLNENPLMTEGGRSRIRHLCSTYDVHVGSLTGDCFMQAPFWKTQGAECAELQHQFENVVRACSLLGINKIVVPLVDNGAPETDVQQRRLIDFMKKTVDVLRRLNISIVFECEYDPEECHHFIEQLPETEFGINYDIGNSAAMGFNPVHEFAYYGSRIKNVHVKDRPLNGTTVPLGLGGADFPSVFKQLAAIQYDGYYILQTARADLGKHSEAICRYATMVTEWISNASRS